MDAAWPEPLPQARPARKGRPWWILLLLVGLAALLAVGSLLSVLLVYEQRRFASYASIAEARNSLLQIAIDARAAYDADTESSGGGGVVHRICPSASRSVPASMSQVRGRKYRSSPEDWSADHAGNGGFACLTFSLQEPQSYRYSYTAVGASAPGDHFVALAEGDLNGDGRTSEFRMTGEIGRDGQLEHAPTIAEKDPEE